MRVTIATPKHRPALAEAPNALRTVAMLLFAIATLPSNGFSQSSGPALTSVKDTVYKSDGSPATGSVVISWDSFLSQESKPIFGGSKTITLNNGALLVALIPNIGATPSGTSYTVRYYQSGAVYAEEFWVVPNSTPTAPPSQPNVTTIGASGSNTYCYWISATRAVGETTLSPAGCTFSGLNSLSTNNFNRVSWTAVSGAISYRVFRTPSSATPTGTGLFLVSTTSSLTVDDQSASLQTATIPEINTTDTRTLQQVRVTVPPAQAVAISPSQVTGTAIVSMPIATQTITAPASSGTPLQIRAQLSNAGNLLNIFDSPTAPTPKSWFNSSGTFVSSAPPILSSFSSGSLLLAGSGGQLSESNNQLFWDTASDRLRVGPRTGLSTLLQNSINIYKHTFTLLNPPAGTTASLGALSQSNNAGSYNIGAYTVSESNHASGNRSASIGLESDAYHTGAGTISDLQGIFGFADNTGPSGGNATRVSAIAANAWQSGNATTTEMNGLLVFSNGKSGGTVTNNYGVKIEDQTGGTNNWAIKTGLGKVEFGGPLTTPRLNNIRFADQFAGADAGAKIAAAIADLPAEGGTVDARGFEGTQAFTSTLALNKPITLLLGNATFIMTGGTTELIRIGSQHVQIIGNGWANTVFQIGSGVGPTIDAIRIAGAVADIQGLLLKDFLITPQSGTPGRYAIHFDTTTFGIYQVVVDGVKIDPLSTYAIYSTNPTLINGFFLATIQQSWIDGGIKLNRAGDTIRILNNRLFGSRIGVEADFVPGASTLIVSGNNITSSGGGIKLGAATVAPIIAFNEIETLSGFTGSNGAVIDIDGDATSRARNVLLTGNRIQVLSPNSDDHGIRINYADETHIEGNYFSRGSGSAKDIFITTNATTTKIGENTWQDSVFANILSDAGVETSFAASLGGNTQMRQPLTFANGKSIGWYDDGGTARPVLTTQADGSVTVQGYHGNNFLVSSGGITYIYDSGSTKTLSAYAGNLGIGPSLTSLPAEALHLPTAGRIGWDNGAGGVDVLLYRRLAFLHSNNHLEFGGAANYFRTAGTPTAVRTFTLPDADSNPVQPAACSGTDKVSAISSAGILTCSADAGGAGSGDNARVEDGDNAGTFTAMSDVDFDDSGDIDFQRIAGPPDSITGVVRPDSIALTTDTTGNYVGSVADGLGIDGTASGEGANYTPSLDLTEINSHTFGDNSTGTLTQTFDPTGAINPAWSYSNGVANLSTGSLQQGGAAVALQSVTLTAGGGLTGGGDISASRTFDVAVTAPIEISSDTVACSTCTTASNSQSLANKTFDSEGSGNVLVFPQKIEFQAAGCDGSTAASAYDLPTSNAPSKSCQGSSPHRYGVLDFADGATALTANVRALLPSDWTATGGVDIKYIWSSGSTSTNSVVWTVQTSCVADGEDIANPSYNAGQTVADANNAAANTRNSASISGITMTGCSAGESLFLKIGRDPTNGSDTLAATALLHSIEITIRRQI
jgi:hypothetical protein